MLRRALLVASALAACAGPAPVPAPLSSRLDAAPDAPPDASADVSPDGSAAACPACPEYAARGAMALTDDRLDELSGIVEGRAHAGVFYVHNDSGDRARFFAVSLQGAVLGEYRLAGVTAVDWEDVAAAPCGDAACLYLGDIGDNDRVRAGYVVHRVREPDPSPGGAVEVTSTALPFRYADGAHNAESLVADVATGDLYVITKEESGASGVYRYEAAAQTGAMATLPRVASLALPPSGLQLVTGAALHPTCGRLLVRTYVRLFEYERPPGAPFEAIFQATPREVAIRPERQGEAVAWRADGSGYVTVAEGAGAALNVFACGAP